MRNQRTILLLFLLTLVVFITVAAELTKEKQLSKDTPGGLVGYRTQTIDPDQFPTVDFDAPEPANTAQREKRAAKGNRYHKPLPLTSNPNFRSAISVHHWPVDFSPLPVQDSNAVVIGEVRAAEAYLSTDKTDVYSEFTISVIRYLKGANGSTTQSSIVITRPGGGVRFRDGSVQLHYDTGLGMPRPGRIYVFFLKNSDQDFDLLTAYELRDRRVKPLDSGTPNFSQYDNEDEAFFLKQISQKIVASLN